MDLTTFTWSVIASLVAAAIIGGVAFKVIHKNKTNNSIKQKGEGNTAYMNSTIHNNNYEKKKGD